MADRENRVIARIAPGVATLDAAQWDALAGAGDPFLTHAFLSALEESGSVGEGTGWTPAPIVVEGEDGAIAAAAPAYLKSHSQGEYVFDHGWAEAFERAGGRYYPKLQVAVPFTPVPGRRLLGEARQALLAYRWSGNVRELRNVLERAAIVCEGGLIAPEHLSLDLAETASRPTTNLRSMERRLIEQVLRECRGNKSRAAVRLGLTRKELYGRLRLYGIE